MAFLTNASVRFSMHPFLFPTFNIFSYAKVLQPGKVSIVYSNLILKYRQHTIVLFE